MCNQPSKSLAHALQPETHSSDPMPDFEQQAFKPEDPPPSPSDALPPAMSSKDSAECWFRRGLFKVNVQCSGFRKRVPYHLAVYRFVLAGQNIHLVSVALRAEFKLVVSMILRLRVKATVAFGRVGDVRDLDLCMGLLLKMGTADVCFLVR